jgi:hypothetical protein
MNILKPSAMSMPMIHLLYIQFTFVGERLKCYLLCYSSLNSFLKNVTTLVITSNLLTILHRFNAFMQLHLRYSTADCRTGFDHRQCYHSRCWALFSCRIDMSGNCFTAMLFKTMLRNCNWSRKEPQLCFLTWLQHR